MVQGWARKEGPLLPRSLSETVTDDLQRYEVTSSHRRCSFYNERLGADR